MTLDSLQSREQALENEFFHKVDQELLEQLRERIQNETKQQRLGEATGLLDSPLLEQLVALGIQSETILALHLVPLIQVAWSEGYVTIKEREAILQVVKSLGHEPASGTYQLLETWLAQVPRPELFQAWKGYVNALAKDVTISVFRDLEDSTLKQAKRVAQASGGVLGIGAISESEKLVLEEIKNTFTKAWMNSD